MLLCGFAVWVVDVNGAFLLGELKNGDLEIYMEIPEGMQKWYTKFTKPVVAKLKKCIYGTKQAAKYYYNKVVTVIKSMKCERSSADPCLFFKWDLAWGLVMWLTWIDDKLCIANAKRVEHEKELLKKHFKCDNVGRVKGYIGCKIDMSEDGWSLKMIQPVLVQSLTDEFKDILQGKSPTVPAKPGNILTKCKNSEKLDVEQHSRYSTEVGNSCT